MILARFKIKGTDGRPMVWPVQLPFWITGYSETHVTVVAYARNLPTLRWLWPDAEEVDASELVSPIAGNGRFRLPDWYTPGTIPVFFSGKYEGQLRTPKYMFEMLMAGNKVNFLIPHEPLVVAPAEIPGSSYLPPRIAIQMFHDRISIPESCVELAQKCLGEYIRK